jgi:hypothetical protein
MAMVVVVEVECADIGAGISYTKSNNRGRQAHDRHMTEHRPALAWHRIERKFPQGF